MTTISEYADQIMTEIHNDMEQPFPWGKQIPRDVGSFSALHDYCDANMYLLDAVPDPSPACDCDMSARIPSFYEPGKMVEDHTEACAVNSDAYERAQEAWTGLLNAVSGEVDRRLAVEAGERGSRLNIWQAIEPYTSVGLGLLARVQNTDGDFTEAEMCSHGHTSQQQAHRCALRLAMTLNAQEALTVIEWREGGNWPYIGARRLHSFTATGAVAKDGTRFTRAADGGWQVVTG